MQNNTATVLLCGVGGQGTILAADILARCAIAAGKDVKLSEIHGMSQRGGAVTTVVRIGDSVSSMVADKGCADYLVSFETVEALRNISYLREGGFMVVSDESIKPLPVLTGMQSMPENTNELLLQHGAVMIPAKQIAEEAGSIKALNVVLLGALSVKLDYPEDLWLDVIAKRVPAKFKDVNIAAFKAARAYVENHQA